MIVVASLLTAATLSVVPVSVDALNTVDREISNPSGERTVGATSAAPSEGAAFKIDRDSTLTVLGATSDDGPAYTSTGTLDLPRDRTMEQITIAADESGASAVNQANLATNGCIDINTCAG